MPTREARRPLPIDSHLVLSDHAVLAPILLTVITSLYVKLLRDPKYTRTCARRSRAQPDDGARGAEHLTRQKDLAQGL
jgi:hypothetical protein